MHCTRNVTEDIIWVGANDRRLSRFENLYPLTSGVSYNSYLILIPWTRTRARLLLKM